MEIVKLTENEDGSATLVLDMTETESQILIEYAVIDLLKKFIEIEKSKIEEGKL